ncbi:MAG TPA: hypothetical protein VFM64_04595, partial [Candidatus Nitrosotenuis sp.]|nr:hypothetical protein [Candidatus Nitrosotenuis sp.]
MKKIIFGLIFIALVSGTFSAFAQINLGQPANQSVIIKIDEKGNAHITHVVQPSKNAQQLSVINNDYTNLQITTQDGEAAQYGTTGGEKAGFLIFPTNQNVLVEYDLENAVTKKDAWWSWNYLYQASTTFYLPEKVNLVFVNGNPINLGMADGIKCHGCQVKLEYQIDKTETLKQIQWEDKKFDVRLITTAKISSFAFDQPNKKIVFDTDNANEYVTMVIPKELLSNPYEVLLNNKKLLKHEFYSDDTNIWLNMKPNATGTVEVIGTSVIPEFPI